MATETKIVQRGATTGVKEDAPAATKIVRFGLPLPPPDGTTEAAKKKSTYDHKMVQVDKGHGGGEKSTDPASIESDGAHLVTTEPGLDVAAVPEHRRGRG